MPAVRTGLPSKPRQTKRTEAGQGQGSSPRDGVSWFRGLHRLVPWICRPAFVHRAMRGPRARVPQPYCAPQARDGETDGHPAHPRFPRHPTSERPVPRRRPRRRARQFPRLREGASRFQDLLRGEGKPGAGDPAPACRDGLVLRHRVRCRSRDGDGCRRAGRPHLLRQHHQEGARHRARLSRSASGCSPSTASRRSRRSPAPHPARACSAAC